jgi:hypothetical protein
MLVKPENNQGPLRLISRAIGLLHTHLTNYSARGDNQLGAWEAYECCMDAKHNILIGHFLMTNREKHKDYLMVERPDRA